MHFASSGNRKPAVDGKRKCESSTFAIVSQRSREKTFTFGVLRHKQFLPRTFHSSFCLTRARDFKWLSYPEALLSLFHLGNSRATCPPDAGFRSGFHSLNFVLHRSTPSSRNTCKTSFSFKGERMVFDTRSSSTKSGWMTARPKTKRQRTRFPLPRTLRQPAMTGTLKSSGTRWIVLRSA